MASTELALENVTMSFDGQPLLKNVSVEIKKGESLVLIGPSGQGKTVILKLFAGLLRPTSGRVLVCGEDLYALPHSRQVKLILNMGMLFQKNALFDSLRVGENIAFPLRETTSLAENQIQERVDYFLAQVGLTQAKDLLPDEISGGMQKRLGIARALALNPKIVLYDDPTAGLDPITSRRIADLILDLKREQGSTVVAVTNDMARAYQLADNIAMIVDGELILTGNRESTLKSKDPRVAQFIRGSLEGPLTENFS